MWLQLYTHYAQSTKSLPGMHDRLVLLEVRKIFSYWELVIWQKHNMIDTYTFWCKIEDRSNLQYKL